VSHEIVVVHKSKNICICNREGAEVTGKLLVASNRVDPEGHNMIADNDRH
jgi:hypothetical protein